MRSKTQKVAWVLFFCWIIIGFMCKENPEVSVIPLALSGVFFLISLVNYEGKNFRAKKRMLEERRKAKEEFEEKMSTIHSPN